MPVKRVNNACRRGHTMVGQNVIVLSNGYTQCRECRNLTTRTLRRLERARDQDRLDPKHKVVKTR